MIFLQLGVIMATCKQCCVCMYYALDLCWLVFKVTTSRSKAWPGQLEGTNFKFCPDC